MASHVETSAAAGTRTLTSRIKSPLPYPLGDGNIKGKLDDKTTVGSAYAIFKIDATGHFNAPCLPWKVDENGFGTFSALSTELPDTPGRDSNPRPLDFKSK